jgi:hypothetical protein
MFAGQEVTVDVAYEMALARLARLLHEGTLSGVCDGAYEGGLAALLRVGPFGDKRGVSKLVRVCFAQPARRGATVTVPLRWEAAGAAGDLFPVLDADLIVARHGDDQTMLALTGCYRPPFGRAGALIDRTALSRVATATIRSVLRGLAAAITCPAPLRQPAHATAAPRPAIGPAGPCGSLTALQALGESEYGLAYPPPRSPLAASVLAGGPTTRKIASAALRQSLFGG